jgi:hypothetical protein
VVSDAIDRTRSITERNLVCGSASALNAEFAEDAEIAEKNSRLVPKFRSADVLGRCAAGVEPLRVGLGLPKAPGNLLCVLRVLRELCA